MKRSDGIRSHFQPLPGTQTELIVLPTVKSATPNTREAPREPATTSLLVSPTAQPRIQMQNWFKSQPSPFTRFWKTNAFDAANGDATSDVAKHKKITKIDDRIFERDTSSWTSLDSSKKKTRISKKWDSNGLSSTKSNKFNNVSDSEKSSSRGCNPTQNGTDLQSIVSRRAVLVQKLLVEHAMFGNVHSKTPNVKQRHVYVCSKKKPQIPFSQNSLVRLWESVHVRPFTGPAQNGLVSNCVPQTATMLVTSTRKSTLFS